VAADGSIDLHARYTIESDTRRAGAGRLEGHAPRPARRAGAACRGEDVDPSLYYFRTVMRFATAHPATEC
jgi:hypothetical protein